MFECFCVAQEEKVLYDRRPRGEVKAGEKAKDETVAFQVAYCSSISVRDLQVAVTVAGQTDDRVFWRTVESVPCTVTGNADDPYYLSHTPFLCPDVLRPADALRPYALGGRWNALWITVKLDEAGVYPIEVTIADSTGKRLGSCTYTVTVQDCLLGKSGCKYTNWFHYDGLADRYRVPVFSDAYNAVMDRFIADAVEHGMNMLLIPLFTPPLDTRVDCARMTVQLVDVTVAHGKYAFGFERLLAFMKRVKALGIEYFEMSHLFTQWGAAAAPKVMATVDGTEKRIFGWDTPALGGEYEAFLAEFLPALRTALRKADFYRCSYFHLSDEPNDQNIEQYAAVRMFFKRCLPDAPLMDAMSHYEFYERGLVDTPIAATDAIENFLEHNVPDLWAYYCCGQGYNFFSNRFMAMPGERTRVLGMQLFLNRIAGFLQWGYNFYNTALSDAPIDPYLVTDGAGAFPSGDTFIVYPGADGPVDSIRHELTAAAFADLALLNRLSEKIGRDKVEAILLENGFRKDFTTYPHDAATIRRIHDTALKMLSE